MKNLTEKELLEAPGIVQSIYMIASMNRPIGTSTINKAIKDHPEYFPEEVEHREKWKTIPQEVHDNFEKEFLELDKKLMKDVPPSKGIVSWINNPEEHQEWNKKFTEAKEKGKPLHKKLHEKHYSKYGIEWIEW